MESQQLEMDSQPSRTIFLSYVFLSIITFIVSLYQLKDAYNNLDKMEQMIIVLTYVSSVLFWLSALYYFYASDTKRPTSNSMAKLFIVLAGFLNVGSLMYAQQNDSTLNGVGYNCAILMSLITVGAGIFGVPCTVQEASSLVQSREMRRQMFRTIAPTQTSVGQIEMSSTSDNPIPQQPIVGGSGYSYDLGPKLRY